MKNNVPAWKYQATLYIIAILIMAVFFRTIKVRADNREFLSPLTEEGLVVRETVVVRDEDVDSWVDEYSVKYTNAEWEASYMKYQLHCLLHKESHHGLSKAHGDSGKAGGPMQFWEDTWNRMRKQMIKAGLIEEIGSRYDMEQAINTTAWAISEGRELEWGPILRGECK